VHHGSRSRLAPLLGRAMLADMQAINDLMPGYRAPIRRVVANRSGVVGYRTLRPNETPNASGRAAACHIFNDFQRQFSEVRETIAHLCHALGRRPDGCIGSLQSGGGVISRHCDDVGVIAVQLFGSRQWRLEPNSDPPIGIHDPVYVAEKLRDGWSAEFGPASLTVTLMPGSVLYVPLGWWHETRSFEDSFALAISVREAARSRR
jgi:ribosomal protein L16 Arg81 hydroxylase